MKKEIVSWLALQRIFKSQPLVVSQLIAIYKSPSELFRIASFKKEESSMLRVLKEFDEWELCEMDLNRCCNEGIELVSFFDHRYPALLKEIAAPPPLIMVKGDINLLSTKCISIVGARKATVHGRDISFELARDLASFGFTVVSGMAYGIDAAAHIGALETGNTIAVWGSGIDFCYPPAYKGLSERIIKQGCIISEFPLGTRPYRSNFPQRNRIISGLSLGVIVVEAAVNSGSLITARFALDQGREVFAVPGLAKSAISEGTHALIKDGATFIECAEDVISTIKLQLHDMCKNPRHFDADESNERKLLNRE